MPVVFDAILPHLSPTAQVVYLRLYYLTYCQGTDYVSLRYDDLAHACNLSISGGESDWNRKPG